MERNYKKGFTLIELLVVIAIIGILSAVVLASLNTARTRAANASVQSNLKTAQVQAQLYYEDNDASYGTGATCDAADTMFVDETIAQAISTAAESGGAAVCHAADQDWAVSVPFKQTADGSWCVDSTGHAGPGVAQSDGSCSDS